MLRAYAMVYFLSSCIPALGDLFEVFMAFYLVFLAAFPLCVQTRKTYIRKTGVSRHNGVPVKGP